jgi:hypothetical protein
MPILVGAMRLLPSTPYHMFRIDGLGAMLSSLILLVMIMWPQVFGMPRTVLFALLPFALAFAAYSMGCAHFRPKRWKPLLAAIAKANLLYATVTLMLVTVFFEELTLLGKAVFIAEIVVILVVVGVELRVRRRG